MEKSGRWYGVYRADVLQSDGTFKREQCWQPLGLVSEQSERSAWKQFQPYLDKENDAAKKLPPRIGLTLAEFVEEWRTNVAVNLKGSTTRAAESHLRAHIIPKLGNYHLPEITTKIVQGFVAYLAGGGRSRKTAENVLLTLSSLLRTARSWGYACGDFRFADLTLPREGVRTEPRSFTDDEVRKIIANASEPLSTIVMVTAVLGLRIGETLALRTYDVDFGKHVIRVRQSVDAATRTVCGVKSKASSADLPMSKELEARLRTHLQTARSQKRVALRQSTRQTILSEQTAGEAIASALGCTRHPSRWIPFDETRRREFPFGGRRNSSRCAEAAPSFRRTNHARNLRPCCRGCAAQRGSESLDKTGELRAIVRKPRFVRKSGCKSLKTNWFGRGGGDRKQYRAEFKGLRRNAGERQVIEKEQ